MLQKVFEKTSNDENNFILIHSLPPPQQQQQQSSEITFYTLNFNLLQAFKGKYLVEEGLSVVEFSKDKVTLSNNQTIDLEATEFAAVASMLIPALLLELPRLRSKCERQEELLLDYKQRLGITDPTSPERKKKTAAAHRDLLNPRVKKPTTLPPSKNIKRGFVDDL